MKRLVGRTFSVPANRRSEGGCSCYPVCSFLLGQFRSNLRHMSNNQLRIRKALPERLRSLGLDESWLQEQIARDTSLLGFGELNVVQREKIQPSGGRIDFLMFDPETDTRYEVEVMLGTVDESHIIRTIEYWDMERQRYPTLEHRAVIVAEEITSRFFNVIRLLNRAVPIIAIQLSAFRLNDEVVLQFTRVLDTYEFGAEPDEDDTTELVDRGYWERKAKAESLAVVEAIRALTPTTKGGARITYNKYHLALGTTGYNVCWFHPRRAGSLCHMQIKIGPDRRQEIIDRLESAGVEAENHGRSSIRLRLSVKDVQEHKDLLTDILHIAEEFSHR
jgi:hypothetical protein